MPEPEFEQTPSQGVRRALTPRRPPTTRALAMHAAPLKYKTGTMRRWVEEDNRGLKLVGIRWLLREDRRGLGGSLPRDLHERSCGSEESEDE